MSVTSLLLTIMIGGSLWFPLRYGAEPERYAALIYGSWIISSPLFMIFGSTHFSHFDTFNGAIDFALCVGLIWLALKANRVWPLFAAAFSCLPMVGHLIAFLGFAGMQRAYWAMTEIPSMLIGIPIIMGALWHQRRIRRGLRYGSWIAS